MTARLRNACSMKRLQVGSADGRQWKARHWTCVPVVLFAIAGGRIANGSPVEQCYIPNAGWCPGLAGPTIQDEHGQWHTIGFGATMGLEFVEFHREFLGQSDDYRLYDICVPAGPPEDAVVPVFAQPGSMLKFGHTSLNLFARPAGCDITLGCGGGAPTAWTPRPATLRLRNPTFHANTDIGVGMDLDSLFHGNGHVSIGVHDGGGDMLSTFNATRDGAFFQWHKNIDNIYADWAVGQYQLLNNTGTPIFFSVAPSAVGVGGTGSALHRRRQADVYQGNAAPGANQYGAIPRIGSDLYIADNNSTNRNLLYHYGVREWNTLNGWDVDAWTILNPPATEWYFSVTPGSTGAAGSAVLAQAVKGGDVFASGPGTNTLYRAEFQLGLAAAASDNLEGLEVDQQKRVQATNDYDRPGIAHRPRQWFSLRSGSTFGVEAGGTLVGPNDILRFNADGALVIDVSAATLGLAAAGNELDALVMVDVDSSETLTAGDEIYYSLAAGSPALGANSPADILCRVYNTGAPCPAGLVTRTAASLGLLPADDLDALDVRINPTNAGACCHAGGACTDGVPPGACPAPDTFWGPGTVCAAAECPSPPGACCLRDGGCLMLSDFDCLLEPGIFQGVGVSCLGLECPPPPPNDECYNAYAIPYDYPDYYEPGSEYYELPAEYTDNSYAYTTDGDSYEVRSYSAMPNLQIPDNNPGGINHLIEVTEPGAIQDVNVDLTILHSFVGDLCVELEHGGAVVSLIARPGAESMGDPCHLGPPFGCNQENYNNIVLDDEGTSAIELQCTPNLTSPPNYTPNEPLSAFDGMDKFGPWIIRVRDMGPGDLGVLLSWSLSISNDPGYAQYSDPPYTCHDHQVFFPPYGSGTIWYSYDVPPQPTTQSIGLYTAATYDDYALGGYAGDTRIALYYAPNYPNDPYGCDGLEEVACGDNHYEEYSEEDQGYGAYGYLEYYDPAPGRYYVQLSTVGDANRGQIRLRVAEPPVELPCPMCAADLNEDGTVNAADLAQLLGAWGMPGCSGATPCCADLNGSGGVDAADLAQLLGAWGPCH